jgi:hypothetical protein
VTLPYEAFQPTAADLANLRYALSLTVAACMSKHGLPYPVVKPQVSRALNAWAKYGVWRADDARRFGYSPPTTVQPHSFELSTGQRRQEAVCLALPEAQPLKVSYYLSPEVMQQYQFMRLGNIVASDEAMPVMHAWRACLSQHGVPLPPVIKKDYTSVWMAWDLEDATPQQRIVAAVADVRCKDSVDFVRTLADLEHPGQFAAFRKLWLPMRVKAAQVIASYQAEPVRAG